jgi:hypothetical protein
MRSRDLKDYADHRPAVKFIRLGRSVDDECSLESTPNLVFSCE